MYFYETPQAKYEIIDGHQRVRSIARFLQNQFPLTSMRVLDDLNGKRFHQLPEREQRILRTRVIRAIIVSYESSAQMIFEIFGRLNTGAMQLNPEEIRNALYSGRLNQLLIELERIPVFRSAIGSKQPRPRQVDRELVLRFIALRHRIGDYRPPLVKFLNDFARDNRNPSDQFLEVEREVFTQTADRVVAVFESAAFRPLNPDGTASDRNVNRALFDAEMLALSWMPPNTPVQPVAENALAAVSALFADETFVDSIQRATGDRARLRRRVTMVSSALNGAGMPVEMPQLPD